MGAVTMREKRQSLTIDSPEAIADLCSEMHFLDRESLRVVLLSAKQHLIKVATVSQDGEGTEMLQEGVSLFLRTNDQAQMLNSIERFRPIVNQSFLDRGTVRRRGSILKFVKFAYELENMLLHIFRLEAKASAKRPAIKRSARESRGFGETG
jgi:hypothetical protein